MEIEPSNLAASLPGNWTVKNFYAENFYSALNNLHATFMYASQSICMPDDDLIQIGTFENFYFSVDNSRGDKVSVLGVDASNNHYRPVHIKFTNINLFGYQNTLFTPVIFLGTISDTLEINSFSVKNSSLLSDAMKIVVFKNVIFGSLTSEQTMFQNIGSFTEYFISIMFVTEIGISNLKLENVTGLGSESLSFIYINTFPSAPIKIQSLEVNDFHFSNGGILSIVSSLDRVEMSDVIFQNSIANSEISIFELNVIRSFLFEDFKINGIKVSVESDEDSTIFNFNALDLQSGLNSTLNNINITDSQISLIKFGSLINTNNVSTQLEMSNIRVQDSMFSSTRSVISTKNLENDASFYVKLNRFYASNITFGDTGSILLFQHGLINTVVVEDSIFTSLNSASISASSSGLERNLTNGVTFKNCTFENIASPSQSFFKFF